MTEIDIAQPEIDDAGVPESHVGQDGPELAASEAPDSESVDTEVIATGLADTELADTELADTELADTELADTELADTDGEDVPGGSLLVQEGDIAADYLERLLDIIDYDGDIDLDVENDRAIVAIVGPGLQALVGPQGQTLDALQELTRLAVQQKTGARSRLMLDVSGHRQARRNTLTALAKKTAEDVLESGSPVRLQAMNPFERKVVHDAIAAVEGVRSESEGEEPNRCVVVLVDK